jgi:hypothetical protein
MKKHKRRKGAGPNASLPRGGLAKVSYQSLRKAGGMIVARSSIESDALVFLEMDHAVRRFWRNDLSDLERVRFTLGCVPPPNRVFELPDGHTYTPDLRVELEDGRVVYVEVGPYGHKTHPAEWAKLQQAMTVAREEGTQLVILTERELRRGRRLDNLTRLASYLHRVGDPDKALLALARERLEQEGRQTVTQVASWLASHSDETVPLDTCEEAVWAAIAEAAREGRLAHDLDSERLDHGTRFALARDGGRR